MSEHIPVEKQPQFFGHPVGLYILFFTEMWERFSYYGMRGLLKAYMVYYLCSAYAATLYRSDFPDPPAEAPSNPFNILGFDLLQMLPNWVVSFTSVQDFGSSMYGGYTALVYATPFFGGIIADRWLGQRRAVYIGGAVMAVGHFVMASEQMFLVALGLLIIGNGFFKPNISTQVGDLYPPGDSRRDGAFTIFYMGINLGAFICNFIVGTLAAVYGWHYGFGAAGIGMVLGLLVYLFGQRYLAPDNLARAKAHVEEQHEGLTSEEWSRIGALVVLALLNVVFWAVYEQQGNTMQTWADEQTVWPVVAGFQIPSTWFQSFNPMCIVLMAPLLDIFWQWQAKRGTEPTSVSKMAIGAVILGLSFIVMIVGANVVGDGKGSLFWPLACTFLLTIGELYLSPIGLSLVTKVSPAKLVSMMMGMWFISSFLGNTLSGYIGVYYTIWPKEQFFGFLTVLGLASGIAMWAFNAPLKKIIGAHDVKPVAA